MTGQELLEISNNKIFRPTVMNKVISELVPPADRFRLTDNFLPFLETDTEAIIDLLNNGEYGRTNPVNLGGQHARIGVPGYSYREHEVGYWRESVVYPEDVLQKAMNPASPNQRMGNQLSVKALQFLNGRLNTLVEYVTSKILIDGNYSEARNGVNYTYTPKIPTAKYFLDITASPPWTSGGTWGTAANAKPVTDVLEAILLLSDYGILAQSVWMNSRTGRDFMNAADTIALIKSSPQLVQNNANLKVIFAALTSIQVEIDDRVYNEETQLTADSPAADTTLNVVNASYFVANDKVTLRNTLGDEEDRTIASIASNVITLTAGVTAAFKIGDRVTVAKKFLPDHNFIVKGSNADQVAPNNWLSTPSLVKSRSWDRPLPGKYTWSKFRADEPPYTLEIGAGINGGPKVSRCNWLRVKTR